ncbi:DUF2750 domain-containing protein [Shewanella sp. NKUCC05_KAH]|uniref:DUF2750 domain-containing protein n=1 Tax=Shewanella sp. NKUCC05_KAH TaxID=2842126 RepID=UPI001C5B9B11|nr:DUF2750 domain-containing protein [Shewanella sp. NKUCC05_KAH]MBW3528158.1 DUF2750 domain-containing protein [Shewanella sp. NKUCC05_KAH]
MTTSSLHASAFYKEVSKSKELWSIRDSGGIPSPNNLDGVRVMPFWSSRSRAEKLIKNVEAYRGFEPFSVPLSEFSSRWVTGLIKDQSLVGLNWSGLKATGFDVAPREVLINLEYLTTKNRNSIFKVITACFRGKK